VRKDKDREKVQKGADEGYDPIDISNPVSAYFLLGDHAPD
jgi:hypothetical protein